jgi:hypothetical protein
LIEKGGKTMYGKCCKNILYFLCIILIISLSSDYKANKAAVKTKDSSIKQIQNNVKTDKYIEKNSNLDSDMKFTYTSLPSEIKEKINGNSFKSTGPISMDDLAYVQVIYWGFDDKEHKGELIVNKKIASEVVDIFKDLYEARFQIEKIKLIDDYNSDDNLSMNDNNTYAYCYRYITGSKNKFSKHSYGIAIDINPVQNPYIKKGKVLPEAGKIYVDRKNIKKGMVLKGDSCYKAFKDRGWTWGGEWKTLKDYQHFEKIID